MGVGIRRMTTDEFRRKWRHWGKLLLDADERGGYWLQDRCWLLIAAAAQAEDWDVVADLYLDRNGPEAERVAAVARGTK